MRKTVSLVFEKGRGGRKGAAPPENDVNIDNLCDKIPKHLLRKKLPQMASLSEPEVIRHYYALSKMNFSLDEGFYPLGSCTMKYNPRLNEELANIPGFGMTHPLGDLATVQGSVDLLANLGDYLAEITGMDAISCQPSAGAHGEFTGLLIIRAAMVDRGQEKQRRKIIIPDSAHGTNPASVTLAGFETIQIPSGKNGLVDLEALKKVVGPDTAGFMLTNPNTVGLFEKDIIEISKIIHDAGGLLYYDGANLNAIMGVARPGDMGFDIVHLNLHKSFSTPHGGGGPGSGPVGVKRELEKYLPIPVVSRRGDGCAFLDWDRPKTIGKVGAFLGNFGVIIKAYAYILTMGHENLPQVAKNAVLNANFILKMIEGHLDIPFGNRCMHEFVASASNLKEHGIKAMDLAKALLDNGYHAPTMYFPLIVPEALMIEPTETESPEDLERFAQALIKIVEMAKSQPESLHEAPEKTPVGRLDEVGAARKPVLRYDFGDKKA